MSSLTLAVLALSIAAPAPKSGETAGHDWPQWRGPNRDGVSKETSLLKSWPKQGPPLLWTCVDAGVGYSGPAVVGDRLFLMGGRNEAEYVYALDCKTGRQI